MITPDFRGVHYSRRLDWAKDNLRPFQTKYAVVYQQDWETPAQIMHPSPEFMAAAMQGGILPPIEAILALKEEAESPGFRRHTLGPQRDAAPPLAALTEEESVEYQIMQSIPRKIWDGGSGSNSRKMVICHRNKLPASREFRDAWRLNLDLEAA